MSATAVIEIFWPIALLLYLPNIVSALMRIFITRAFRRLDMSHPDDLPQTAGQWLADELKRLGLDWRIGTLVSDSSAKLSIDAYHPLENVIMLSADTHFKRDPMHWAIAAHELGHARLRQRWPRLARATIVIAVLKALLIVIASALLVGNFAFAIPHVTDAAFLLFAIATVLHCVALADEIIASVYAMQSLRASPVFTWSHMRSARKLLVLAFSTYLVGFLSHTLLLTQWHVVEQLTRAAVVPPLAELTVVGLTLAVTTSAVLIAHAILKALAAWLNLPDRVKVLAALIENLFTPALVGFVLLVYNVRADTSWAYMVMGALVQAHGWFLLVLTLPLLLVDRLVLRSFIGKLVVDPTDRSRELSRDYDAGRQERRAGNKMIEQVIRRTMLSPPPELRLAQLFHVAHVPLVIAFWLS